MNFEWGVIDEKIHNGYNANYSNGYTWRMRQSGK